MSEAFSTGRLEWLASDELVGYLHAIQAMRATVSAIRVGSAAEKVWLLEHPPLYTAWTSAKPGDLQDPTRFDNFSAGRGGQWTYHGPGQVVAYVMLDLDRRHGRVPARDTHAYVAGLEEWLKIALAQYGVQGVLRKGRVGVWVKDEATGLDNKIAAIGIRITRWVSWHGVSLNVSPDLGHFSGIVPCGIRGHGVTSLRALGIHASVADVRAVLQEAWGTIFA